ncbi:MAG: nucleotidyltransferase domain-containing protein [Sulfurimonas sp.]
MRLTKFEIDSIKSTFLEVFNDGKIYLFGSRTNDIEKGGDIDLFIQLKYILNAKDRLDKKSQFKLKLEDKIGEQKIDIIISKDTNRTIEKEALKGILL